VLAPLALVASHLLIFALACRTVPPEAGQRLLRARPDADPELELACHVTAQRCTRCHDLDRIVTANVAAPASWERTIERMRRMNGSGISRGDSRLVLRCLVFSSFGRSGLDELDASRFE
jgi:hypothetical protein